MAEWRLLAVVRLARDVTEFAGPREAARQTAFALSSANWSLRLDAKAVIAAQAAKGTPMPRIGEIDHHLDRLAELVIRAPVARRRFRLRESRSERLPVEAARAVPIVDVLSRYGFTLRRVGQEYVTRCPFGEHRRPHLLVSPKKNLWRCWPCNVGGDTIAFLMRYRGLGFAAAVRELAA
jgi:CHC2 zinc finger